MSSKQVLNGSLGKFRSAFLKLGLKAFDNTVVHLADTTFAEIKRHADLFHCHFLIIVKNHDQLFVTVKPFGDQTHQIGLQKPDRSEAQTDRSEVETRTGQSKGHSLCRPLLPPVESLLEKLLLNFYTPLLHFYTPVS